LRYEEEFLVDRSPDEVFEYLADAEHIPQWAREFARAEKVGDGPPAKGMRFRLFRDRPPKAEWALEWTAFQPGRLLEWRASSSAPVVRGGSYTISPDGDGRTHVAVVVEPVLAGPARLFAFVLAPRLRHHARRDIARLRERLSAGLAILVGVLAPVADWAEALLFV
jgi:uncharacterized protein YndB with AHSA1/START domain